MIAPYRSTPVFDQDTLPPALMREHRTKAGVWGMIRLLEGQLRLTFGDGEPSRILRPEEPGLVEPEQTHWVEPIGPMRMQIDFFDRAPPDAVLSRGTD